MAEALRRCEAESAYQHDRAHEQTVEALRQTIASLSGRRGLVFLVSDFHWPLQPLHGVLEQLAPACVVPIVAWDPAEIEPPSAHALVALSDAETGVRRTLWMREPLRRQWADAVVERRAALHALFSRHGLAPFHFEGRFDAEALTRHFMEAVV